MLRAIAVVAFLVAVMLTPAAQAIGPQPEIPVLRFEDLFRLPLPSPGEYWCCPCPWWLPPGHAIQQRIDAGGILDLRNK
jgi:hypothetical protein